MAQHTPPLSQPSHNAPDNSPVLTGTTTLPSPHLSSPRNAPTPNLLAAGPGPAPHPSVESAVPISQPKWRVSPQQKEALLAAFEEDAYPELQRKTQLSEQLGVTTTQISKWFQHRRESLTRLGQFKAQYNRTRRTPQELDVLQSAFDRDRYPNAERLAELEAQLTGVTAKQIKLWFKHRRKQVQKRARSSLSPQMHTGSQPPTPMGKLYHDNPLDPKRTARPEWPAASILPAPGLVQPMQPGAFIAPPASAAHYAVHPGYYYKSAPIVMPPRAFSEMELMALRGAHAVCNSSPTQDAVARLAQFLNRPPESLSEWFRSQEASRLNGALPDVPRPPFVHTGQQTDAMGRLYNTDGIRREQMMSAGQNAFKQDEGSPILEQFGRKTQTQESPALTSNPPGAFKTPADTQGQASDSKGNGQGVVSSSKDSMMKADMFVSADMVPHVHPGIYPTYVYSSAMDSGMIMSQQRIPFPTPQPSSGAPMLAPLRYAPTAAGPQYVHSNQVWYGQAPGFSKG